MYHSFPMRYGLRDIRLYCCNSDWKVWKQKLVNSLLIALQIKSTIDDRDR